MSQKTPNTSVTAARWSWAEPVGDMRAYARGAARRRHNEARRDRQLRRRHAIARWLDRTGLFGRGVGRRVAERFRVSPATASRDLAALMGGLHRRDFARLDDFSLLMEARVLRASLRG